MSGQGQEVAIRVEQRYRVLDASSGDQAIDRFADSAIAVCDSARSALVSILDASGVKAVHVGMPMPRAR